MTTTAINSLQSHPAALPSQSKLKATCQDFESILVSYMLKSMRGAGASSDLVEKNMGEKIFTDMLDDEYAKLASRTSRLGLADLLYRQLSSDARGATEAEGALHELQNEANRAKNPIQNYQTPVPLAEAPSGEAVRRVAQYNSLINVASRDNGVDPNLVRGMILRESLGVPHAVSSAGAKGLMQLMDTTAGELGVTDPFDPAQNIAGGTKYLKLMLDRFNGNEEFALASYNAGPGTVETHKGIPPYPETQTYVESVLKSRQYFRNLYGG